MSAATATARGRLAVTSRHYGPDADQTRQARRDLEAAKLADHIRRVVDTAPPLTLEQRIKLSALLRTPAGNAR
ncbi:hypothetical protein ACI792_04440 [Blastococcus sp. SYSU DS0669]